MKLFIMKPPKTNKELQAELKALVCRLTVDPIGATYTENWDRYETLLKEIYLRGSEPEVTIKLKTT